MKHTEGLMRQSSVPENGYELYFDERDGMVRIRFFDILGPAEPKEGEELTDSVRYRIYDIWEYDIEGIEMYVSDNAPWLVGKSERRRETGACPGDQGCSE